jgi:hypothetical protein
MNPTLPGDSIFKPDVTLPDTIPDDPESPRTATTSQDMQRPLTQQEIVDLQAKKDKESNWLLQGYEESMKLNSSSQEGTTADEKNGLYSRIASDKNLAKLAGVPFHESSDPNSVTTLHTGANKPVPGKDPPQDDSSAKSDDRKNKPFLSQGETLQPFLAPLNSSETKNSSSTFFGNSGLGLSTSDTNFPKMNSTAKRDTDTDAMMLETPGLTAAQSDPLVNNKMDIDSSIDTLPDEPLTHAEAHQDIFTSIASPSGSDMVQMQDQQKSSLNPPETFKSAQPVVISPLLLTPQDTSSAPKIGVAAPAPVRPRVADPRDFLNQ